MATFVAWYSFQLAAEEVERRLGVTWGAAQKALLRAIESGKVQWQRDPDGGGFPDVMSDDLEHWLEGEQKPQKRRVRSSPQQDLAKQAIAALYPDGRIPDGLTFKQIVKSVNDWREAQDKVPLKRDSISRAVGRRK